MNNRLRLAGIFRSSARLISVFLILILILYILFAGIQVFTGEPAFAGFYIYFFILILMCAGFIIAWRNELVGAVIAFAAVLGYMVMGWSFSEVRQLAEDAPTTGAVMLVAALLGQQSFDPMPVWILVVSWLLLLVPIGLFLASWQLRRGIALAEPPSQGPIGDKPDKEVIDW